VQEYLYILKVEYSNHTNLLNLDVPIYLLVGIYMAYMQKYINMSMLLRCIVPERKLQRAKRTTRMCSGIKTVQTCSVMIILLILIQMVKGCFKTSGGFECYTGDGPIMRRKSCPAMGNSFSDMCFKKEGAYGQGETMRGCFNSVIASLILADDDLQEGCHEIPRKFGTGQICVCDSNLCNSATSLTIGSIPSKLSLSTIVRYATINRLYFPVFMFFVILQKMILNIT